MSTKTISEKNEIGGKTIFNLFSPGNQCSITEMNHKDEVVFESHQTNGSQIFYFRMPQHSGAHVIYLGVSELGENYIASEKLYSDHRHLPDRQISYWHNNQSMHVYDDFKHYDIDINVGGQKIVEKALNKDIKMVSRYEMPPELDGYETLVGQNLKYEEIKQKEKNSKSNWLNHQFKLLSTEIMPLQECVCPKPYFNNGFAMHVFFADCIDHFIQHTAVAKVVFENIRKQDYSHCELSQTPYFPYSAGNFYKGDKTFQKVIGDYPEYVKNTAKKLIDSNLVKQNFFSKTLLEKVLER